MKKKKLINSKRIEDRVRKDTKIGDGDSLSDNQLIFIQKIMKLLKHLIDFGNFFLSSNVEND